MDDFVVCCCVVLCGRIERKKERKKGFNYDGSTCSNGSNRNGQNWIIERGLVVQTICDDRT